LIFFGVSPDFDFAAATTCSKPTIELFRAYIQGNSKNGTILNVSQYVFDTSASSRAIEFTVPTLSIITFVIRGSDGPQTRNLTIRHKSEPGIPSLGCVWSTQSCAMNSSACTRNFTFSSQLLYSGQNISVCFEAVNDQKQCPYYQTNSVVQPFGVYFGAGINGSQASENVCVLLRVPLPKISWGSATPDDNARLVTYAGCPLSIDVNAMDDQGSVDVYINPVCDPIQLCTITVDNSEICDSEICFLQISDISYFGGVLEPPLCRFHFEVS
jgi:hypothetical protein